LAQVIFQFLISFMLEKDFTSKVRKWMKTLPNTWFVKIQQAAVHGTPDILACVNGVFVALELKRSENASRTKLQQHVGQLVLGAGGYFCFMYPENFEQIKQDIERMANDHS